MQPLRQQFEDSSENTQWKKSNKCNQCDYAFFQAGHLREHLKMHSGKKLCGCNQCDYASSYASTLNRHLKTHSREVKQMQSV